MRMAKLSKVVSYDIHNIQVDLLIVQGWFSFIPLQEVIKWNSPMTMQDHDVGLPTTNTLHRWPQLTHRLLQLICAEYAHDP